ncbi:hypothetical protein G6F63_016880 [Rhizopus arrhizus]|nr:hypothetical protein G6F63_016880 [Rhizopus arrhizus]KAG1433640.1 hypothetical protein G6F56_014556 [Rhizopus delemar]
MPNFRPLAIALGISLATLVPTHDAFAAAKKKAARAPAVSAQPVPPPHWDSWSIAAASSSANCSMPR